MGAGSFISESCAVYIFLVACLGDLRFCRCRQSFHPKRRWISIKLHDETLSRDRYSSCVLVYCSVLLMCCFREPVSFRHWPILLHFNYCKRFTNSLGLLIRSESVIIGPYSRVFVFILTGRPGEVYDICFPPDVSIYRITVARTTN